MMGSQVVSCSGLVNNADNKIIVAILADKSHSLISLRISGKIALLLLRVLNEADFEQWNGPVYYLHIKTCSIIP